MNKISVTESDMQFGKYEEDKLFKLEQSAQYRKYLMMNGVKCCEFILLRDNAVLFIEAKKSCPNYLNANSSEEKKKKYEEYVNGIVQKMQDSLALYASILLERYDQTGIPGPLRRINKKTNY